LLILGLCAFILTQYSAFGRALYATGGNSRAAVLSGIPVQVVKITVFMISGFLAAMMGILESARLSYINPAAFGGVELEVLAVTVLGGAALAGGSGSILGTLVAALIIGVVNNLLNQLGVSIYLQQVVTALVILAVVLPGLKSRIFAK
jgi:ribose/xylose/arabinose/galactoside ABC-type transport system permease subunit